ncbi:MAG: nucleoside kinase [Clostridia bacterium]|nr:nucleoside kinase [Clostridia bacterium]
MSITIRIREESRVFSPGTPLADALKVFFPEEHRYIYACLSGGKLLELNTPLTEDADLLPITYTHEEGRRIYERTLRFVFLMAAEKTFPGARVRIEHSIGYGIFVRIRGQYLSQDDINVLQEKMEELISSDLPIRYEKIAREDAYAYLVGKGDTDRAELVKKSGKAELPVYVCGGMMDYFYGAMLPSTGWIHAFSLRLVYPGLTIMMPSPADWRFPAAFTHRPKNLSAFSQSIQWCDIMNINNASDLNRLVRNGQFRDLVRVNEALHDKSMSEIADSIMQSKAKAIFVAGPSSSGKTTFSNRLAIHLRVLGFRPVLVSLDDFYRDRSDVPLDSDGNPDLEALEALDVPYLNECIGRLLTGQTAMIPHYSFKTGMREEKSDPITLGQDQLIIFEGIHALNPVFHIGFDPALLCRIYISELTCINIDDHNRIRTTDARLLRRLVRDYAFRASPAKETLDMWPSVRAGEEKWIFPYQENVDHVFNSVLHYELPVIKPYAEEVLSQIGPEDPQYLVARRLLDILGCFDAVPRDLLNEIPPLSLLREFIGGCTFYTED